MPGKAFRRTPFPSIIKYLTKILIIAALYFITGKTGLSLGAVNNFATLVWPPTGIAFATLFLLGFKMWPSIAIGAFFVNFATGASLPIAIGIAIGNTLEGILGVFIAKKFFSVKPRLARLKDATGFIIAVFISTTISAIIGTTSLVIGNSITFYSFPLTWITWWVGDILGGLIVAPLLLVWTSSPKIEFSIRKDTALFIFLFLLLIFSTLLVFTGFLEINTKMPPIEYIVLPPLIWIALRFGQRSSVSAFFLVTIIAIWGTVSGYGVFIHPKLSDSLLFLQGFIGINACTFLLISAVVSEFKTLEARKDSFVALASHELKTPITSLKIYSQVLVQRFKKQKNSQSLLILQKMDKQIDRQIELINELLDISRIQAGKLEYHMKRVNVADIVNETIESVELMTKTHIFIAQGNMKYIVYADNERIRQVLINLIVNAIKYSQKSQKIIIRVNKNKYYVIISVQDFGIGISKTDQEKIFEQFFQVGNGTYSGLGLGLYISSEIIKRHRGKLWVKSIENKGSIFYFTIPLEKK